ncbi:hypothetical protein Tco_0093190 [Tanacetum coccineum]
MVKTGLVEAIDSLVPLDEHFATFRVWGILERIFKKKAKNDQTKHGMEKTKSIQSQSQSKSKVSHMKKIQLEGLKLPNLKLCYKKTRAEIENCGGEIARVNVTTATSLYAEQDMGNIDKTQSKVTPNEPSSLGTISGGGPRRQETIGDTIAQTRFENVSKQSNDLLLERGNTLQSGEDRLQLQELMELCTNLQNRVINLENTKTAQAQEITSLKLRIGRSARVISSDESSLGGQEDAYKQGRKIDDIDKDAKITLVHETQGRYGNEEMFDTDVLDDDEVLAEPVVTVKDVNLSVDAVILAQALAALKIVSTRPKAKRLVIHEEEQATTPIVSSLQPSQLKVQDKGKEKMEGPEMPMKKKEQIRLDEEIASKLQAEFDEEVRLAREKAKKEEEANIFAWDNVQAMMDKLFDKAMKRVNTFVDMDTELVESSEVRAEEVVPNKEEVAIDVIPLATKPPSIVDWKIHKEGKKSYYQIIRADGSSKIYLVFSHMLKSFDSEDLETLYKLVKAKYGSTRSVEYLDLVLYGELKTMFDPHIEDQVWKNQSDYKLLEWKLYDSCGVHSLRKQNVHIHMLVEKRYPLTTPKITDMLNKKLKADHWNKMYYQLLKLITKQLKNQ